MNKAAEALQTLPLHLGVSMETQRGETVLTASHHFAAQTHERMSC